MQEVDINGEQRIDCIFGDITGELQQNEHTNRDGRDRIPLIKGLLETGGIKLALLAINEDILYQESPTFREKLLGLFSKSDYWFEIRGTCLQAFGVDSTKFQYFILIHEKSIPNPFIFNFDLGLTFEKNINNDNTNYNNEEIVSFLKRKLLEYKR